MRTANTQLRNEMVQWLSKNYGNIITRQNVLEAQEMFGINGIWLTKVSAGRGLYDISGLIGSANVVSGDSDNSDSQVVEMTDQEILEKQRRGFGMMDRMVQGVINGKIRGLVIAGPPGVGKSYSVEYALESAKDDEKIEFTSVKGFMRPTGLYRLLYENRHKNSVLLLDDADSVFDDPVGLNLLKAALDSSKRRHISWKSERTFETNDGEQIPTEFEFFGSVIFISNLDFENYIASGKSLAPHMAAIISRSYYIDLTMNSVREYVLRIQDVLENSDMAETLGLTENETKTLIQFVKDNQNKLRELSLRMVVKLAGILGFSDNYQAFCNVASATCFKTKNR